MIFKFRFQYIAFQNLNSHKKLTFLREHSTQLDPTI